jgi:hypothetical protein
VRNQADTAAVKKTAVTVSASQVAVAGKETAMTVSAQQVAVAHVDEDSEMQVHPLPLLSSVPQPHLHPCTFADENKHGVTQFKSNDVTQFKTSYAQLGRPTRYRLKNRILLASKLNPSNRETCANIERCLVRSCAVFTTHWFSMAKILPKHHCIRTIRRLKQRGK